MTFNLLTWATSLEKSAMVKEALGGRAQIAFLKNLLKTGTEAEIRAAKNQFLQEAQNSARNALKSIPLKFSDTPRPLEQSFLDVFKDNQSFFQARAANPTAKHHLRRLQKALANRINKLEKISPTPETTRNVPPGVHLFEPNREWLLSDKLMFGRSSPFSAPYVTTYRAGFGEEANILRNLIARGKSAFS